MHEKFFLHQNLNSESLDYSKMGIYLTMLREVDRVSNQLHWIFDYSKNCFIYITENTGIFPKRENTFVSGKGYQCLIDNTHPDDEEYMLDIQKKSLPIHLSTKKRGAPKLQIHL